ncbi:MAG: HAD family hydrolase [Hyphomicrobiales bacterium]
MAEACAIIFDIDGVLLHLTEAEENVFFQALEDVHGITGASRDWNSYKVRNDIEIIEELVESHYGRTPTPQDVRRVADRYRALLDIGLKSGALEVHKIEGIEPVLLELGWRDGVILGVATANLKVAADLRLKEAGLKDWISIGGYADGRGPKSEILRQVIARLRDDAGKPIPKERIVFLGDNPNDVRAGVENGVHFIGFAVNDAQDKLLRDAGAQTILSDHLETLRTIDKLL